MGEPQQPCHRLPVAGLLFANSFAIQEEDRIGRFVTHLKQPDVTACITTVVHKTPRRHVSFDLFFFLENRQTLPLKSSKLKPQNLKFDTFRSDCSMIKET